MTRPLRRCLRALRWRWPAARVRLLGTHDADPPQRVSHRGRSGRASAGASLPAALAVARPRAASSLDTERIAVVRAGSGFDYFAGVRWSDPAPQMLQQLLVDALVADARFATAVAAPSRVPAELLLDVELRRFEAVYATRSASHDQVECGVTLVDVRRGLRLTSFSSAAAVAAARNDRAAVVAAFEQAADRAVRDAAAAIAAAAAPKP